MKRLKRSGRMMPVMGMWQCSSTRRSESGYGMERTASGGTTTMESVARMICVKKNTQKESNRCWRSTQVVGCNER